MRLGTLETHLSYSHFLNNLSAESILIGETLELTYKARMTSDHQLQSRKLCLTKYFISTLGRV